jgi:signal transduction histidine kinase
MPETTSLPPPPSPRLLVQRQAAVLRAELEIRLLTSALAYALETVFIDWRLPLICASAHLALEAMNTRLMRGMDPVLHRGRLILSLLATFLIELCFVAPVALIWHLDTLYAKPFAVGLATGTIMHLTSVRSIYLPMGIAGLAAVGLAAVGTQVVYWAGTPDGVLGWGFALSMLCLVGTLSYGLGAMLSNNHLHVMSEAERGRAEAASAAKGRFLAQMSHELRTPLNAILGIGRVEAARAADPATRDRLGVLVASAEGLNLLLNDILDMAAAEAGRMPVRPVVADPRDLIRKTCALFRPAIEANGLGFHVTLDPGLPEFATFDPQRLRQCLTNLLANAMTHTRQGAVSLQARPGPGGPAGGTLRIEIADTGAGIPPEARATVFDRHLTTRGAADAQGGRGLGLGISRTLARAMGGDLVLDDHHSGPGTRFVLTLALPAAPTPVPAPRPAAALQPVAALAGRVFLVVDDLATNRMVAGLLLEALGARMQDVASGAEALAVLADPARAAGLAGVLLDMNMPGMGGAEVLMRLRALPGPSARLPVVAMTADAGADQRAAHLALGLDGYVTKPLDPATLACELSRVLAQVPGQMTAQVSGQVPGQQMGRAGAGGVGPDPVV